MAIVNKRSPSDSVFRISKTISDSMYARLKSFNDLYSKDSKQWRYFTYCRETEAWSLDKENEDWKNENLPAIKHATLRWLVKSLVYVSEWDTKAYHLIFLEVLKAAQSSGEGYALALSDEGITIGLEQEYFDSVQEILRLQRNLIDKLFQNPAKQSYLKANFDAAAAAKVSALEIFEIEQNYYLLYQPIKVEREKTGTVPQKALEKLSTFCLQNASRAFITATAKRLFLIMDIPRLLLEKQPQQALKRGAELMELYLKNPWLKTRFSHEFHRNAVDIAALALVQDNRLLGEKYLSMLIDHFSKTEVPILERAPFLILAKARLYDLNGNQAEIEEAFQLFNANRDALLRNTDYNVVGWALFFCAKAAMNLAYWETANDLLKLLNQAPYSGRAVLSANARIMHLLCLLEIESDQEYLIRYSETASTFVSRKSKDNLFLRSISSGIRQALAGGNWSDHINKLAENIRSALADPRLRNSPEYFDYPKFLVDHTRLPKSHQ
jgi:hypothetical protein